MWGVGRWSGFVSGRLVGYGDWEPYRVVSWIDESCRTVCICCHYSVMDEKPLEYGYLGGGHFPVDISRAVW